MGIASRLSLTLYHTITCADICDTLAGRYPKNFTDWLDRNEARIANAKSLPYFLADNEELISGATVSTATTTTTTTTATEQPAAKGVDYSEENAVTYGGGVEPNRTAQQITDERHANRTEAQINSIQEAWKDREVELAKNVLATAKSCRERGEKTRG